MALWTKSDLATHCGISRAAVSQAVNRDKKLVERDGMINDQDPTNKATIQDWLDKKALKPQKETPETVNKKSEKGNVNSSGNLRDEKLKLETEKLKEEIEKLRIQNAKANAEVIPTELASAATIQYAKTMAAAYRNSAEDFITMIGQRYSLTNADIASARTTMLDCINQANEDGTEAAMKTIEAVANDYAAKRGVGEHS